MRNVILIDIDHTISAAWPRDGMIGIESWDAYHAASANDTCIDDMRVLVNTLHGAGFYTCGLTARPSKWRSMTMKWLIDNRVRLDEILMRDDNEFRPSPEMKTALALEHFPDIKNQVAMLLEDREDVVAAFKALGITVLQVHGRRD